jgi:hypothetical protein
VNDDSNTCTEIVNINSCELYSSREFKYNINAFTRVDIKDSYTEDDKLAIFDSLHNNVLGHRGATAMIRSLKEAGYKWETLREDVVSYIKNCATCQKVWQDRHGVVDDHGVLECYEPFQRVSIDFQQVSSEPDIDGYKYLCNFVD